MKGREPRTFLPPNFRQGFSHSLLVLDWKGVVTFILLCEKKVEVLILSVCPKTVPRLVLLEKTVNTNQNANHLVRKKPQLIYSRRFKRKEERFGDLDKKTFVVLKAEFSISRKARDRFKFYGLPFGVTLGKHMRSIVSSSLFEEDSHFLMDEKQILFPCGPSFQFTKKEQVNIC